MNKESNHSYGISAVLARQIEAYVGKSKKNDKDTRLLVPGLTKTIGKRIHEYLVGKGINSFFVIGDEDEPSEELKLIKAVGLTSKRIGSFVAIASPGQLVHIQDSIRGSGGTIRSISFSEEWPWIDNGSETFRYRGPAVNELVASWTDNENEQLWLKELACEVFVRSTLASPKRAQILLDEILESFTPELYPNIKDIREKLLFHAGIPAPKSLDTPIQTLARNSERLSRKIVERFQKEEGLRSQAADRVQELFDPSEQNEYLNSINQFLDGLGSSRVIDLGALSFYGSWGNVNSAIANWKRLTQEILNDIFDIRKKEKATIAIGQVSCSRGLVSGDCSSIATFDNEEIRIRIEFNIPDKDFNSDEWNVRLLNRQRQITEATIDSGKGNVEIAFNTSELESNFAKKINLRVTLEQAMGVRAYARLNLHVCAEERPAFAVVRPGFQVVDAGVADTEESADVRLTVDEPVQINFLSNSDTPEFRDENDKSLDIIETGLQGIWQTSYPVDAAGEPSGQATRICRFGEYESVITFEASESEKGAFTIESEFLSLLSNKDSKKTRLTDLGNIFLGQKRTPYSALGGVDETVRSRNVFTKILSSREGWRPILTDLLSNKTSPLGSVGDYVSIVGEIEASGFFGLKLPPEAENLLKSYSEARHQVRESVESYIESHSKREEHPTYASNPIYVLEDSANQEERIQNYVDSYQAILDYLKKAKRDLEWNQLFLLTYLDCVVQWGDISELRNSVFLIGPWHPLVVAKRFMVQSALLGRYQRLRETEQGKIFRHLTSLLEVSGFSWVPAASANEVAIETAYARSTSDPGWHFAIKTNLPSKEQIPDVTDIAVRLWNNLGLQIKLDAGEINTLPGTSLSNFVKAFPSRRSVGLRVRDGYIDSEIVKSIDKHLHGEEGPSAGGKQLPGGVRLYLETPLDDSGEARWTDPPLYVYHFKDEEECLKKGQPDIYVLPPVETHTFKTLESKLSQPRGMGLGSVFSQRLCWLTEGQTQIPKGLSFECDLVGSESNNLGGAFIDTLVKINELSPSAKANIFDIDLPQKLNAPWVVLPGRSIDPAILVKYVRDGIERHIQERALWDYKVDVSTKESTYYILSTVPRSFQVAVNGFFDRSDIASDFITELGRVGIAIGGEALKSGRHAMGIIGLVGASRLLLESTAEGKTPLTSSSKRLGFLIPVDSFESFFGRSGKDDTRRTDLLAIQLTIPKENGGVLSISSVGVESKLVSGTFNKSKAISAIEQAKATCEDFQYIAKTGIESKGFPERLALLKIISFGLRISSPTKQDEAEDRIDLEQKIYSSILQGKYEYKKLKHEALLVSTEGTLPGACESTRIDGEFWIRLTKSHWPGVSNSNQLERIRKDLVELFEDGDGMQGSPPATLGPSPDVPDNQSNTVKNSNPENSKELEGSDPNPEKAENREPNEARGDGSEPNPATHRSRLTRILIGVDEARSPVYYNPQSPIDPLDNMNTMVTGSSGKGKTQFLKYLITQLRKQGKNVMVLDFKKDFGDDTEFCEQANLERVFVNFDGLPLNPLIPYPIKHPATGELFLQSGQHIAGVASVLKQTYGLGVQQQAALKNAIVEAFQAEGLSSSGSTPYIPGTNFPDLSTVGSILEQTNPAAFNRLDPLFTLGLFREEFRDQSFQGLVERSVVLDLSQIPSDDIKSALAQLIVLSSHSYYNAQEHSGTIRQFLVFDEAHRVAKSDYILRLVRECRAYGVGTILSSQYPSDFPPDISASMATKIIHGNGRDIDRVKAVVDLLGCAGREGTVANLGMFEAMLENRHYPDSVVRTMNYPLFLVWYRLQELKEASRDELSKTPGFNADKLPIGNIIEQMERNGLAEESDGIVRILYSEG